MYDFQANKRLMRSRTIVLTRVRGKRSTMIHQQVQGGKNRPDRYRGIRTANLWFTMSSLPGVKLVLTEPDGSKATWTAGR